MDSKLKKYLDEANVGYKLNADGSFGLLDLSGRGDEVLEKLAPLDKMYDFSGCTRELTDAGIEMLSRAKGLTEIHFPCGSRNRFSPESFRHLANLPRLRSLQIAYEGDLDALAARVGKISTLTSLYMHGPLTDRGVRDLVSLTQLTKLDLGGTHVCLTSASSISQMKFLQHLTLEDTPVTDEGLREVAHLIQLEGLNIAGTKVTDDGLLALAALPKLRFFAVSNTSVTDVGIKWIVNCQEIESLYLHDTRVSDASISYLSQLRRLRRIDLQRTNFTPQGLEELIEHFSGKLDIGTTV